MLQQLIFALVTLAAFGLAAHQYRRVYRNIRLGKAARIDGPKRKRWRNLLLVAFGQKKMFKKPVPALLHLFIYLAFLVTQIELVEILIDGFTGGHRTFAGKIGWVYPLVINTIELLSVGALVATVAFLVRRNLLKVARFHKPEMAGWPTIDANLILFGEILLLIGIFTMNGADAVLQGIDPEHYPETGPLLLSDRLGPWLFGGLSQSALVFLERFGWWLHLLVVYAFLNYLPISKHLHILLAFPNTYFARLAPKGKLAHMPEVEKEVRSMLDPNAPLDDSAAEAELPVFGAADVMHLTWKHLLDAYTCTECGRCTAACPANITGKKLSPRHIVMAVRDRAEEVGKKLASGDPQFIREELRTEGAVLTADNFDDGRNLFDYIAREEIHACTTCNACVEACPVLINPLDIIVELRRYEILTEAAGPPEWLPLFNAIENSGSAWAMAQDRDQWAREET